MLLVPHQRLTGTAQKTGSSILQFTACNCFCFSVMQKLQTTVSGNMSNETSILSQCGDIIKAYSHPSAGLNLCAAASWS